MSKRKNTSRFAKRLVNGGFLPTHALDAEINHTRPVRTCQGCGAEIWRASTKKVKFIFCNIVDGERTLEMHYATCPALPYKAELDRRFAAAKLAQEVQP